MDVPVHVLNNAHAFSLEEAKQDLFAFSLDFLKVALQNQLKAQCALFRTYTVCHMFITSKKIKHKKTQKKKPQKTREIHLDDHWNIFPTDTTYNDNKLQIYSSTFEGEVVRNAKFAKLEHVDLTLKAFAGQTNL